MPDHPRARPMLSLLKALSAGPLTPVALGKRLRGVIVDWRNFLAEAEALGLVSWRSPLWKLSPFGAQYLTRTKAGEPVKLAFWDAPEKPKRASPKRCELSVGDEFAQARRRRRASPL